MKIIDVKVEVIHIPMKKPFRIAFAVQDHSVNVLVKVMTDEGIYGIGEALRLNRLPERTVQPFWKFLNCLNRV